MIAAFAKKCDEYDAAARAYKSAKTNQAARESFIGFPARKPLPLGRGGSAASSLLFDVTLDDLQRSTSARDCAV